MNKQTIITFLLALVAMAGQAQEIKKVAATPEVVSGTGAWVKCPNHLSHRLSTFSDIDDIV